MNAAFRFSALAALCALAPTFAQTPPPSDRETLFQASTIGALLEGVYDGALTLDQLAPYGDFGLGTFNGLDGEMVVCDGRFYQVNARGAVHAMPGSTHTPFAVVTFFDADRTASAENLPTLARLQEYLDSLLPTPNICYAVRVEGLFSYVKTRSVPKQTPPYPKLAEVVKTQPTFEFRDVRGVLIGFRLPGYMKGLNVPGYHLHFLSDDRRGGGHLLDCQLSRAKVELDYTSAFHLLLPGDAAFYAADVSGEREQELQKVEK